MFLFEAIAGSALYDVLKLGLDVTTKYLKNIIKVSVLENLTDEDLLEIVKQVNGLSDEIKNDKEKLENAINNSSELNKIMSKIDCINEKDDSRIVIKDSTIDKSPIINSSYGSISINYGKE